MSVELDRQLREYCQQMDELQGVLTFEDVLEQIGDVPTVGPLAPKPRPRRGWIPVAATVAGVFLTIVVGLSFLNQNSPAPLAGQPTVTTTVVPRTDFPESGLVEAGTYRLEPSASTVSGVTLTMPEGWVTQDGVPAANKTPDEEAGFAFYTVGAISSDTCARPDGMTVGPTVDDLALALLDLANTSATGPVDTTLGGLPAKRVDLTFADGFDASGCNAPGGLQIWYSQPADNYFVLLDGHTASVYIADVDGERQVLVTQVRSGVSDGAAAELQGITDSIRFDG